MDEITTIISTVGFPIAMCILMAWFIYQLNEKHTEQIEKINLEHKQEMTEVTKALNNNTVALQRLTDFLLKGEENND